MSSEQSSIVDLGKVGESVISGVSIDDVLPEMPTLDNSLVGEEASGGEGTMSEVDAKDLLARYKAREVELRKTYVDLGESLAFMGTDQSAAIVKQAIAAAGWASTMSEQLDIEFGQANIVQAMRLTANVSDYVGGLLSTVRSSAEHKALLTAMADVWSIVNDNFDQDNFDLGNATLTTSWTFDPDDDGTGNGFNMLVKTSRGNTATTRQVENSLIVPGKHNLSNMINGYKVAVYASCKSFWCILTAPDGKHIHISEIATQGGSRSLSSLVNRAIRLAKFSDTGKQSLTNASLPKALTASEEKTMYVSNLSTSLQSSIRESVTNATQGKDVPCSLPDTTTAYTPTLTLDPSDKADLLESRATTIERYLKEYGEDPK